MAEEKNIIFGILGLVSIVAIVGIIILFADKTPKQSIQSRDTEEETLTGQAYNYCYDMDKSNLNPYKIRSYAYYMGNVKFDTCADDQWLLEAECISSRSSPEYNLVDCSATSSIKCYNKLTKFGSGETEVGACGP